MFKLLIILVLTSLLSARPQTEAELEGYDVYGEYYDNYDYEDSYDSQDQVIGSSQAGDSSRFPRQTFTTGNVNTKVNSVRGVRGGASQTTPRPSRQSQRQQSARQTASNPPLG